MDCSGGQNNSSINGCCNGKTLARGKEEFIMNSQSQSEEEQYKARLVAQGFTQEEQIMSFGPVARLESLRTLVAWSVQRVCNFTGGHYHCIPQ